MDVRVRWVNFFQFATCHLLQAFPLGTRGALPTGLDEREKMSRRPDLPLRQKTMGHASVTVTAYIYADLYGDELDDIAMAREALDDVRRDLP